MACYVLSWAKPGLAHVLIKFCSVLIPGMLELLQWIVVVGIMNMMSKGVIKCSDPLLRLAVIFSHKCISHKSDLNYTHSKKLLMFSIQIELF